MTLFALVVVGYIAGKLGYLGGDFDRQLSRLVINITCPALILSSAMSGTLPDRRYILPLLGISVITYLILTGAALFLPRYMTTRQEDEGAVGFAMMFGNVGFMGYPVVASIFGHQAVFYAAVLNVVNTFAVFTIGTILITGKSSQPLTMLGNITVPAALLIIGSSMSQLSLRMMLGNRTVYLTTIMRLLIVPLSMYYLCRAIGFSETVVNINTVVIAMPVATYGTILCLRHEKDATLMTEVTFITTLFSMLTIPLLVMFFL